MEDALGEWNQIDVLKLDVEGMEARLLAAIHEDLLERVGTIYIEGRRRDLPLPPGFKVRERCQTVRLRAKRRPPSRATRP